MSFKDNLIIPHARRAVKTFSDKNQKMSLDISPIRTLYWPYPSFPGIVTL